MMKRVGEDILCGAVNSQRQCWDNERVDDSGVVYCKTCGEPKTFLRESPFEPKRMLMLTIMCRCEREREADARAQEQREEANRRLQALRTASLMGERTQKSRFENWRSNGVNDKLRTICERYVANWPQLRARNKSLLLHGPSGSGKTFAAACIGNALIEHGVPVLMVSLVQLLHETERRGTDFAEAMRFAELLILDDLGADRGTDTATERVFAVIDARYRQGKPMVITSNLTTNEIQSADVGRRRIFDRLGEDCVPVSVAGYNWRGQKAREDWDWTKAMLGI